MHIEAVHSPPIHANEYTLTQLLDKLLPTLKDQTIIAITSKVVSLCEGAIEQKAKPKDMLVKQHADFYLPKHKQYGHQLTVKNHTLVASAGIDESNGNGDYVLWPSDPQASANAIRAHLRTKHKLQDIGVIITDSTSRPLRRGTTGIALAHSGFAALYDYRQKRDIFGKILHSSVANIAEGLAAGAVVAMGEGAESTPIARITHIPTIQFQAQDPTPEERAIYQMEMEDDVFAPLLTAAHWQSDK